VKLPDTVLVTVTRADQPIPDMWVVLEFPMAQKNPYQLAFGPTNGLGQIRVTADEIRAEALKVNNLFLMDYVSIERFWTGTLRVTPMNRPALERALSAQRMFHNYKYPEGYREMLQRDRCCTAEDADRKTRHECPRGT
jgi:hypothetical protein